MSIASQLTALEGNISDAYDMVSQRGGTIPARKNMENLDDAIASIPSATTPGDGVLTIQKNGTTLGTFTANQSSNETIDIDAADSVTMLYVSDMGSTPSSVTLYKDEEQTEAASAQFIKDAFLAGKVVIYDDEFYFFAEIVAASEDGYPGTDITFKIETGWETPSSGTDPEPEIRYLYYSSFASTTAELSFVYLTQSFRGATSTHDGAKGYVPAPLIADRDKVLTGAGTWANITGSNMDFSSAAGTAVIKTITDNLGRTGIYFADGTLITTRKVQYVGHIDTAWGTLYEGHTNDYYKFAPAGGDDFIAEPNVQVTLFNTSTSGSCWLGAWEKNVQIVSGGWAIPAGALCFLRASAVQVNVTLDLHIQAIGRWK